MLKIEQVISEQSHFQTWDCVSGLPTFERDLVLNPEFTVRAKFDLW